LIQHSLNLDELVKVAGEHNSFTGNLRLFRALGDSELFFPMETIEDAGEMRRSTPLLRLPDGTHAMMVYTSKSHPDLLHPFAGGCIKDILAAASSVSALDWVILSNSASQWISVHKRQISAALDELEPGWNESDNPDSPSADLALEELITRAVHEDPEPLSQPIASLLSGRELFLELNAASTGEVGEPVLNMYKIQHFTNVIRAYSTRIRPRITYAGITWEALKEMVRKQPEIQGVQIINDADDWVVFDRESPVMH
jgi:hypothetical protein